MQNVGMKNLGFTLDGVTFHKRVIFHVGKSQNINKADRKVRLWDKRHVNMKQCLYTVCQHCYSATVKWLIQWEKIYTVLCCVRTEGREDPEQYLTDLKERKHITYFVSFSPSVWLFLRHVALSLPFPAPLCSDGNSPQQHRRTC